MGGNISRVSEQRKICLQKQSKTQACLKALNKKHRFEITTDEMTDMFADNLKDLGNTFFEQKKISQDHITIIIFNKTIQ